MQDHISAFHFLFANLLIIRKEGILNVEDQETWGKNLWRQKSKRAAAHAGSTLCKVRQKRTRWVPLMGGRTRNRPCTVASWAVV